MCPRSHLRPLPSLCDPRPRTAAWGLAYLLPMALSAGPEWPFRYLRHRRIWSRPALAWSAGLHAVAFLLLGWATHGWFQGPNFFQPLPTSRLYALHFLVLTQPDTRTASRAVTGSDSKSGSAPAGSSVRVNHPEPERLSLLVPVTPAPIPPSSP